MSQLDPILDDFEAAARRTTFKAPRIPVLSPLLGRVVTEGQIINATCVRRATREPVDFESTIRVAKAEDVIESNTVWIDIVPHPVCNSFQFGFEDLGGQMARMTAISNIFHPDLLGAAAGHKINGKSVLTASISADIGLTAGENLYKRLVPDAGRPHMDLRNMEVFEAQVVSDKRTPPGADRTHFIQVEALLDMSRGETQPLAIRRSHCPLLAKTGAFQLAVFVMNAFGVQASDIYDDGNGDDGRVSGSSRDYFYITPGWRHLRMAEPLEAGPHVVYRNYVRMWPVDGEAGAYVGDIYLLRSAKIVGVCAGIKFKRVPRALMPVMYPQRSTKKRGSPSGDSPVHFSSGLGSAKQFATVTALPQGQHPMRMKEPSAAPEPTEISSPRTTNAERRLPRVTACIQLIANETGLDMDDLSAEAAFAELGVDSLMPLTLAEKMQAELEIPIKASVFLECRTVHDFEQWPGNHES
ncbi:hypothetical protein LZ31DRAFT_542192 [Colletotrichum somersetense]|nr:hypothetical protein LZ31DRAFT_542192 [Colletotrichum somersetense]